MLKTKKVALIIAFKDFRDIEYFIPKDILLNAGIKVLTASNENGVAIGADGGEAKVDIILKDLKPEDFDGIIFIGGSGALKYLDNELSYKILQKTKGIIGAICIAPVILARSGILKNKKSAVWSDNMQKMGIKILKENGAIYQDTPVVVDGNIITASGSDAAEEFGAAIVKALGKEK